MIPATGDEPGARADGTIPATACAGQIPSGAHQHDDLAGYLGPTPGGALFKM